MIASIKSGASIRGIRPEMAIAWTIVCSVCLALFDDTVNPVITEGTGAKHSSGSLHYVGLAIDVRSNTMPVDKKVQFTNILRSALGPEFDVILEAQGSANEHIHVEFQPK